MVRVNLAKLGKGFFLLSEFGSSEAMDVGFDSSPSPADLYMANAGELKLKLARSPTRLASPPVTAKGPNQALCLDVDAGLVEVQRNIGLSRSVSPATDEGGSSLCPVSDFVLVCLVTRDESGGLDDSGRSMVPTLMAGEGGALGSLGGNASGARRS